jgi:mRNA-degrading endonuclease YafQ of YafQ-DinJ toxin-antitoxin module
MSIEVVESAKFTKDVKNLRKRYRAIEADIEPLITQLQARNFNNFNPHQKTIYLSVGVWLVGSTHPTGWLMVRFIDSKP